MYDVVDWIFSWRGLGAVALPAYAVYAGRRRRRYVMEEEDGAAGGLPRISFAGRVTGFARWVGELGSAAVLLRAERLVAAGRAARDRQTIEALEAELGELKRRSSTSVLSSDGSLSSPAAIPTTLSSTRNPELGS